MSISQSSGNSRRTIHITETSPLLHDTNCVYCHVDLELGDQVVVCDSCDSPHHADCWEANRSNCATFGCEGVGAFAEGNHLERVPVVEGKQSIGATQTQPTTLAATIVHRMVWPLAAFGAGLIVFVAAQSAIFAVGDLIFDALSLPNEMGIVIVLGGLFLAFELGVKAKNFILRIRDRRYQQS